MTRYLKKQNSLNNQFGHDNRHEFHISHSPHIALTNLE